MLSGHISGLYRYMSVQNTHKWHFRQNDMIYIGMVGHMSCQHDICRDNHDIYRGFRFLHMFPTYIEPFPVKLNLWLLTWTGYRHTYITRNGCSYIRYGTIYELPFFMKKAKWQRIWVPATTYEQPSAKTHAKMKNSCSYIVVGAHMCCHFYLQAKAFIKYILNRHILFNEYAKHT